MHPTVHILFGLALAALSLNARAQCPFDPTVLPTDLILCPNEQGTLTTQTYESYQWYKDGLAIPDATEPTYQVNAFEDGGSYFSVDATSAGCTERSPEVLVDGFAFLPPSITVAGSPPIYFTQNGPIHCDGDTVLLILNDPYDTNIQWTIGGTNLPIPGATGDTLIVTDTQMYSVSGAPSECPQDIEPLGYEVTVFFQGPQRPDIIEVDGMLCADPPGVAYQWYLNQVPLDGSDVECIDPMLQGAYVVDVTYTVDCSIPSEPFLTTALEDGAPAPDIAIYPNPTDDAFTLRFASAAPRTVIIRSITGQVIEELHTYAASVQVDLDVSGSYLLAVLERGEVISRQVVKR